MKINQNDLKRCAQRKFCYEIKKNLCVEAIFLNFLLIEAATHMEKFICNIYVEIYEIYFREKLYNWNIFCMYFLYKSEIYSPKYVLYKF